MAHHKIRQIGNSFGVILPAGILRAAGFHPKDEIRLVPGPGEIRIEHVVTDKADPTEQQIVAGRAFMRRYRNAFSALAKE